MIKKITLGVVAATLLLTSNLCAASGELSKKELSTIKSDFKKLLGNPNLIMKKGIDRGSFKQIEIEARSQRGAQKFNVFLVDGVDNVLFFGKAYDKEGKSFEMPKNFDIVKAGVALTIGNGAENIYIVTDPDCPWCQKLEKEISDESRKRYTINIIPMPLPMHHNAKNVLYWVLSAKDNKEMGERLHAHMVGNSTEWKNYSPSVEDKARFDKILAASLKAANELGATGTPAIYDENLDKMSFQNLVKAK